MKNTEIEWCRHTLNFWHGCFKISRGCRNCYADTLSRRYGRNIWGNNVPRLVIKSAFSSLDKFQQLAESAGEIHSVFVGSMQDVFELSKPLVNWNGDNYPKSTGEVREEFFSKISEGRYPNIHFLLLTKRPSLINRTIPEAWKTSPPENISYGTSPCDQKSYNVLTNHLRKVNGKRFLSIEPQLAPIILSSITPDEIGWIIQGGESGHGKRPFDIAWARSMRDQCVAWGIPYFCKQIDKVQVIPDDLKIRQFPAYLAGNQYNIVSTEKTASVKSLF